jgi:hypothetical protein
MYLWARPGEPDGALKVVAGVDHRLVAPDAHAQGNSG